MSELIHGITSQPDFPYSDINEENADLLELLLANAQLVTLGHMKAEEILWLYRAGHPAIMTAASNSIVGTSRLEATSHGVSAYETVSAMLASPVNYDFFATNLNCAQLATMLQEAEFYNYASTALATFREDMPRLAEVIYRSSYRFHHQLAEYALAGAAMARQLEIDCSTEAAR